MDSKYFLNEFNSKKAVNTSEGLNVSLMGKRRLLPANDVAEVISQYDVYMDERDKCDTIRLTCQINSLCTNILFNRITEIVKNEGSSALTFINYGLLNGEKSEGAISNKIMYKNKKMSFWSGGTMTYQSKGTNSSPSQTDIIAHDDDATNVHLKSNVKHPTNSIRDTQITNDGFVYHCGLDILNNHLVRSNTFKPVCKYKQIGNNDASDAFNTIADVLRNVFGNKITEILPFPITANVTNNAKFVTMHVYEYDDILTFNDCIKNKLKIKHDGWAGFYNTSKIKSYDNFSVSHTGTAINDEAQLEIERPIMYHGGGDFVDMYPDRSLFSFIPKYNKYRNRYENNWNYCLTYPSSSTTDNFNDIIEKSVNSLKAIYFDENTFADNGTRQLVIYGIAKHGLNVGDYVNIYLTDKDGKTKKVLDNAEVAAIADDFIFTVFSDIQLSSTWVELNDNEIQEGRDITIDDKEYHIDSATKKFYYYGTSKDVKYYVVNGKYVNFDDYAQFLSYKKVVNGIECDYYVRIFSKIPNFKNSSVDVSNEYEIYKNGAKTIKKYQDKKYDFESHPSRLAFAKNIYSDEIGEVVFTDDINIANLKDNLGRPLSSIYLTLVKNNKGYKEWYGYNYIDNWDEAETKSSSVEFAHCFGSVRCGIEISDESIYNETVNSINKINAIDSPYGYDISDINGNRSYTTETNKNVSIDDYEVWFDFDKNYYGDLCYYDNYNAIERSIQPILHRFNTAQRESIASKSSNYFNKFVYDEIKHDDYDSSYTYEIEANVFNECNSKKEGYYYKPHYEIPIKSYGKVNTILPDFLTIRSLTNTVKGTRIVTMEKHYLANGDKSMIYDMWNDKYYFCKTIIGDDDNERVFTCNIYDENGKEVYLNDLYTIADVDYESEEYNAEIASKDLLNFKLFKIDNLNIPSYPKILKDGTCRFIWREIINNGMENGSKTIEEYPFTNGAFYINKRIDLYLRRQDPYDLYGLYSEDDILGNDVNYESEDNYVKEDDIVC